MTIFYKNYKRDDRTLLSIKSVKYLFPKLKIYCLILFDESPSEYDNFISQLDILKVYYFHRKKAYNVGSLSATGSSYNGYYFTEGINKIYNFCIEQKITDKVLSVDEDHFFTTGTTIQFLLDNNFDLAVGSWPAPSGIKNRPPYECNASIVGFNPFNLTEVFPLPEKKEYVEILWGWELVEASKKLNKKVITIPTRDYINYHGDGIHTNNIKEIKDELTKHNIPYE